MASNQLPNSNRIRRDDERQTELNSHTYLPLTVMLLWENLPQILLGALFFSIAAVPSFVLFVLGLPWLALLIGVSLVSPAWVGVLTYQGSLARGNTSSVQHLLCGFRYRWLDSLRLGAVGTFPLSVALWFPLASDGSLAPAVASLWALFIAFGCLLLIVVTIYAFPLLALLDSSVMNALHNGVILSARYLINTLGLAALAALLAFGVIYLSLGLLLILPACFALFVVNNCFLVVQSESISQSGSP